MTDFIALSERLWCGGMPTAGQIRRASQDGVQVVINLAIAGSDGALKDEPSLVRSLGMEYVNIPVQWNSPKGDDVDRFMEVMDQHAGRNILVHCQANYRATAFIALYRVRRQGWKPEKALGELRRVWNPDEYPVWSKFIAQQMQASAQTQS
jgi:protein tyrosine phosphatase (PTP) superfamily phosphohydrolase (DUF442 family)